MNKTSNAPSQHSSTPTSRSVEVSAALIFSDGKLLITQRHTDAHLGGLWEFPGGKREAGETFEQCLVRELREELGIEVEVGALFEAIEHAYAEKTVHLKFFICKWISGHLRTLDCAAFQWITRSELGQYDFPAADARLLRKIRASSRLWH